MKEREEPTVRREAFYKNLEGEVWPFLFIANEIWKWRRKLAHSNSEVYEGTRKTIVSDVKYVLDHPETRPLSPRRNNKEVKDIAAHLADVAHYHGESDPVERVKIEHRIEDRAQFMDAGLLGQVNSVFWALARRFSQ